MTRLLVLIAIVLWLATRRRPAPEPETLPQYDPRLWDAMEDGW